MEEKNKKINKVKPPILVVILGIMWVLSGISAFIEVLLYFFKPIDESASKLNPYGPAIGLLYIYIGFGIIKLKQWARLTILIISSIAIPVSLYHVLFEKAQENVLKWLLTLIFCFVVIFYFISPSIKEKFGLNKEI